MSKLTIGARVRTRAVPTIPKPWRGLEGIIDSVFPGTPRQYGVLWLKGPRSNPASLAELDRFTEEELEALEDDGAL